MTKTNEAGWIEGIEYKDAPDHGGDIKPKCVVMHYSASSGPSAANWLTKLDDVYVSSHFVIDREGKVTQLLSVFTKAYHAGRSEWFNEGGVNNFSVGIELANYGVLTGVQDADFAMAWTGKEIRTGDCSWRKHKSAPENVMRWWHMFTQLQFDAAVKVAREVCVMCAINPTIETIIGHDDISPTRKVDPGPAWDMGSFIRHLERISTTQEPKAIQDDGLLLFRDLMKSSTDAALLYAGQHPRKLGKIELALCITETTISKIRDKLKG